MGNDTLDGGKHDDTLWGGDGDDDLVGGEGNDYLNGNAGNDQYDGSSGHDDPELVDNGQDTYVQTGTWSLDDTAGFNGQQYTAAGGGGSNQVAWTFNDLAVASYEIYITWSPVSGAATDAPLSVWAAGSPLDTIPVNQGSNPNDRLDHDTHWCYLGEFAVPTGPLEVRLTDEADGTVVADAVWIVPVDESGNLSPTASDDSGTGFTTDEDSAVTTESVLFNDTDPDSGDVLFVFSVDTTGTLGTVTDHGDGTFTYDPNGQFEYLGLRRGQTWFSVFDGVEWFGAGLLSLV
jgi:hypothetical protein